MRFKPFIAKTYLKPFLLLTLLSSTVSASAAESEDIKQLKEQLASLKQDYNQRLQQLQKHIQGLENKQKITTDKVQHQADSIKKTVSDNPIKPVAPAASNGSFNPQISAIINGGFNHSSLEANQYSLPGFSRGNEAGLEQAGFGIQEAEINLQASIDPYLYGSITTSLHQEDNEIEVELEEAFIRTQALPAGWMVKAGRFFSGIGYLNSQHSHNWDFVDAPLVYRAFFNNQYNDDGVQIRWQLPTPFYWEIGAEGFAGRNFPAGGTGTGLGSASLFSHIGGDIGANQSWQLGMSYLQTKPSQRQALLAGADEDDADGSYDFSGHSKTYGIDAVWKWAPNGNARDKQLTLQGEAYHRREEGSITLADESSSLHSRQNGGYVQAVYKFLPQWRTGIRYDRIWGNNQGDDNSILAQADLLAQGYAPHRTSFMLDYTPSEFSRIRLQYNRDHSLPQINQQLMLQFIVSLGAHGAHQF
ncbi:MAG: hypothetical protein K0S11_1626 [Gammaproteobacteria bacterium]|jgi:ElaB/YqjD/DUF883 family membrane-anchored ribosome-binding protein|nr:hypothetical protein [Gammaproteobacteria bacterium]